MKHCRILLADDHAVVLEGLRRILDRPDFEIVGEARDGAALLKAAAELHPELIIVDVTMPVLNGIEAARELRKSDLTTKFVFLSMHSEAAYARAALAVGGSVYVLKSSAAEELVDAIHAVLNESPEAIEPLGENRHRTAREGARGCGGRGSPTGSRKYCNCWRRAAPLKKSRCCCGCRRGRWSFTSIA